MSFWYYETFEGETRYGCLVSEVVFSGASDYQKVELLDTVHYGRALVLDGVFQTSEREEHFYHEMLVQPAMVCAPRIERVLVIGGGDGGAAREILRHPQVEEVLMVEIDAVVVEACKEHLPGMGAWDDPRLELIIGDGIGFVRETDRGPFDAIFVDGCDPVGPAVDLFGSEFYDDCARILANDGVCAFQTESPILQRDVFTGIYRRLSGAFPRVHPYFGPAPLYASDLWSWTLASRNVDHLSMREDRLATVEPGCKYYNRDIHRAAFAVPSYLKADLDAGG